MGTFLLLVALMVNPAGGDSAVKKLPVKSPGRAVLFSLLFPGGGQLYTSRYWKAAVIAPTELGLGYLSYQEHLRAEQARAEADTAKYRYYRDRRTTFLWWTAATVVFSMADAYVSAQMFGFEQELRLELGPDRLGVRVAIR